MTTERVAVTLTFILSLLAIALPLSSCGDRTVTGPTIVINVTRTTPRVPATPVSIEPSTPGPQLSPAPAPLPDRDEPSTNTPGPTPPAPRVPDEPTRTDFPATGDPKSQSPNPNCDNPGRGDGNGTPGNGKGRGDERGGCAK